MVFPDSHGVVPAAVENRGCPHCETDKVLQGENNQGDDAEVCVNRMEMLAMALEFVILNECGASDEEQERQQVEGAVDALTNTLLLGSVGRLQTKNRLNKSKNTERLGERMSRKQNERLCEHASPNDYG